MFRKLIYIILKRRHFWRYATFDEVAELYISRAMRVFALRMVATFTTVYLLQVGYEPILVALLFIGFYVYKITIAPLAATIIGRYGPKHAMLVGNVLLSISFPFLALNALYGWWALAGWVVTFAFSTCISNLAYQVDFSKVKHAVHAGKEIGYMNILEKCATALGPLVGGFLAFLLSPEIMIIIAAVVALLATIPLFSTPEQVHTHQRLHLRSFPWHLAWRSIRAGVGVGVDLFSVNSAWNFVIILLVFANNGNEVYAKVGILASLAIVSAIACSFAYGKLIDSNKGFELLRYATIGQALLHLVRPFISTPVGLGLVNVANEATEVGYNMSFMRGAFDTADRSGHRLTYLFLMELVGNGGALVAACVLALVLWLLPVQLALIVFFCFAAIATLLIGSARFTLYKR